MQVSITRPNTTAAQSPHATPESDAYTATGIERIAATTVRRNHLTASTSYLFGITLTPLPRDTSTPCARQTVRRLPRAPTDDARDTARGYLLLPVPRSRCHRAADTSDGERDASTGSHDTCSDDRVYLARGEGSLCVSQQVSLPVKLSPREQIRSQREGGEEVLAVRVCDSTSVHPQTGPLNHYGTPAPRAPGESVETQETHYLTHIRSTRIRSTHTLHTSHDTRSSSSRRIVWFAGGV